MSEGKPGRARVRRLLRDRPAMGLKFGPPRPQPARHFINRHAFDVDVVAALLRGPPPEQVCSRH